jgi:hypothetical protein
MFKVINDSVDLVKKWLNILIIIKINRKKGLTLIEIFIILTP